MEFSGGAGVIISAPALKHCINPCVHVSSPYGQGVGCHMMDRNERLLVFGAQILATII